MKQFKYIMVTSWNLHWDKLKEKWNNSTLFTLSRIKYGITTSQFPEEATTLFIKTDSKGNFEKSWLGISKNFRHDPNRGNPAIRFEVENLKEVACPNTFKSFGIGWHLNRTDKTIELSEISLHENDKMQPMFFKELQNCSFGIFERYCFHLLRLIGIHDIHAIPVQSQQGKGDGFFRFYSLVVIYDATLAYDYQTIKEQQIANYVNQLHSEKIYFGTKGYTLRGTQKQVWTITRGTSVRLLKTEDDVKVKEIPYTKLIEVYNKRIGSETGAEEFCDMLKDLN
jgi:hypothetical protein